MERRFVVPAVTFLSGLAVWVAFFVLRLTGGGRAGATSWDVGVAVLTGCLLFVSGLSCRRAGGPRFGGVYRAIALLLMAFLTFWKAGDVAAAVLLVAAIVTAVRTWPRG